MTSLLQESLDFILGLGVVGCFALFWPVLLLEYPRYMLLFTVTLLFNPNKSRKLNYQSRHKYSVLLAGHNEEKNIRLSVRSLREQSLPPDEILVVSDGSVDKMRAEIQKLLQEGLIDGAHHMDLRGGKSAAINLVTQMAKNELVAIVDCDCSFDRHAMKHLFAPFADSSIAAVSGNIVPRNALSSVTTSIQAIEYLVSISLGRNGMDLLGQLTCVSGAFGGFRKSALLDTRGMAAGGGEDFDITLRLRRRGYNVCFMQDSICYSDVPTSAKDLLNQRKRWEGDALWLRYRKHRDLMNPFNKQFQTRELIHQIEFIIFNILSAVVAPVYMLWLWHHFGTQALVVSVAMVMVMVLSDFVVYSLAVLSCPSVASLRYLPFVPIYSVYNGFFTRYIRLNAYIQEWIFRRSLGDEYVPGKVRQLLASIS